MRAYHLIAAVLFGALVPCAQPAAAELAFSDCTAADYGAIAGAPEGWSCVEIERRNLPLKGGIAIRTLRNKSADPQLVTQQSSVVLDATANALNYLDHAGLDWQYRNITVVMLDPTHQGVEKWSEDDAFLPADADGGIFPNDCIVRFSTANMEGSKNGGGALMVNYQMAHEVFHCIQYWNYPEAAKLPSGRWWMEGSAEFIAHLIYPLPPRLTAFGQDFYKHWTGELSLTQNADNLMPYLNTVFFAWVHAQGNAAFGGFLTNTAKTGGEKEQIDALRAAFSDDQLTQFVRDYLDGKVAMPSGISFPPGPAEPFTIDGDSVEVPFNKAPAQLEYKTLLFTNGIYVMTGTGDLAWSQNKDSGEWGEIDPSDEIDACDEPVAIKVARFRTTTYPSKIMTFRVPGKECKPCITLPEKDKCLMGKWEFDQDAWLALLKSWTPSESASEFDGVGGDAYLLIDKNGEASWIYEDLEISFKTEKEMSQGNTLKGSGTISLSGIDIDKWSSGSGKMATCKWQRGVSIKTTVDIEGVGTTEFDDTGVSQNATFSYYCDANTLAIQYEGDVGEHDRPRWQLKRVQ
ncbi:hypothetical protein sos41_40200 [Alphaproteobacteria bacterium SO-S41]|nr:hypothetical protein sos41_40200 [Alphaproteobacteria bacterium SO-S41]